MYMYVYVVEQVNEHDRNTTSLCTYALKTITIKLMKGKAPRKHEKIAASILLKLFISGYGRCHTTDAPLAHEWNSIFKCKQHTIHDPLLIIIGGSHSIAIDCKCYIGVVDWCSDVIRNVSCMCNTYKID